MDAHRHHAMLCSVETFIKIRIVVSFTLRDTPFTRNLLYSEPQNKPIHQSMILLRDMTSLRSLGFPVFVAGSGYHSAQHAPHKA